MSPCLACGHRARTCLSNAARNWNLVWRVSGSELLALWQRRPRSPSPRPSPEERENYRPRGDKSRHPDISRDDRPSPLSLGRGPARLPHIGRTRKLVARLPWLPLLWGEGWGEGERGRRTDAAAQNVFGACETEPQFLSEIPDNPKGIPPQSPELRAASYPGESA